MLEDFIYVVGLMTIAAVVLVIGVFIVLFLEKVIKNVKSKFKFRLVKKE